MKETRIRRITFVTTASLAALLLLGGTAVAQSIQGVINGRNGATMTVQTQDMGNVVVLLTPNTEAEDVSGRTWETWSSFSPPTLRRKTYRACFMLVRSR
jgi:hypothetical protein